jgi:hypothetical protein
MMNQAQSFTKNHVSKNSGMARRLARGLDSGRALKNEQVCSDREIPLGILDKTGMLTGLFPVKSKFNHQVYFKMEGLRKKQSP